SLLLQDTIDGVSGTFITSNTVSISGTRIYIATIFTPNPGSALSYIASRLYAVDEVQGVPHVAWHWDYVGHTGGSPLTIINNDTSTIYFDGAGQNPGDPQHSWLFAVQDQGSAPVLQWAVDFTVAFGITDTAGSGILVSPARDPRGG